jgi:transcriptional regulator with XRE-family HTH domain
VLLWKEAGTEMQAERTVDGLAFSQLLKQFRGENRVSQSRLAEMAGFDHSYVSRLESGNRLPTREAVVKLAEALRVSAREKDSLLAAAGFMPQRVESLLANEPVLTDVLHILQGADVPEHVRADVRGILTLVVRQARLAAGGPGGSGAAA